MKVKAKEKLKVRSLEFGICTYEWCCQGGLVAEDI